jgi:hypothetical protein
VTTTRVAAPSPGGLASGWSRLGIALFLFVFVVQGSLALAVPYQEIWLTGMFDDSPQADTPAAASEIAALPCAPASLSCPIVVIGSVPTVPEPGTSTLPLEASRTRGPPSA